MFLLILAVIEGTIAGDVVAIGADSLDVAVYS